MNSLVDAAAVAAAADPAGRDTVVPSWTNRFASLGPDFYTELAPEALPDPHWVATSDACARLLGLPPDWSTREDWQALRVFSGNAAWAGMQPLASVYSG